MNYFELLCNFLDKLLSVAEVNEVNQRVEYPRVLHVATFHLVYRCETPDQSLLKIQIPSSVKILRIHRMASHIRSGPVVVNIAGWKTCGWFQKVRHHPTSPSSSRTATPHPLQTS